MTRHLLFVAPVFAAILVATRPAAPAAAGSQLVPQTAAARHGLARPWFTQIQLDAGRGRVTDMVLYQDPLRNEGALYVQTSQAMVHAIDAQTGKTLWAKQIGRPEHPSMTPGLNQDLLVVLNGSRLYACNRFNGDILYEVQVGGAPGAGASVSDKRAYVPMINGMVMAYRLDPLTDPGKDLGKTPNASATKGTNGAGESKEATPANETKETKDLSPAEAADAEADRRENLRLQQDRIPPLSCQSLGHALVQPLVTRQSAAEEFVVWTTDRGTVNLGRIDRNREDRFAIKYRLATGKAITARPTYLPPDPAVDGDSGAIFATSEDGYVYATLEKDGQSLWRFSAGQPIIQPAVVIEEQVFVATQLGGMYCLSAKNGSQLWWAPAIAQFVAASKERIYAADKVGRVQVLNAKTGALLDTLPLPEQSLKLINGDTDRLFLASDTGLVQCLHELELSQPIFHGQARKKAAIEEATTAAPAAEGKPDSKKGAADEAAEKPGGAKKAEGAKKPAGAKKPEATKKPAPPKKKPPAAKGGEGPGAEGTPAAEGEPAAEAGPAAEDEPAAERPAAKGRKPTKKAGNGRAKGQKPAEPEEGGPP